MNRPTMTSSSPVSRGGATSPDRQRPCWKVWLCRAVVGVAVVLAAVPAPAQDASLRVELKMAGEEFHQGEAVPLRFSVRNVHTATVYLLPWNTPLEGPIGDPFEVSRDGEARTYLGALAARSAPRPEEWLKIAPGEEVSASVDLARMYDLSAAGAYEVRFTGRFHGLLVAPDAPNKKTKPKQVVVLAQAPVGFRMVDEAESLALPSSPPPSGAATPAPLSFASCSDPQISSLAVAFEEMAPQAATAKGKTSGWTCSNWNASGPAKEFFGNTCDAIGLLGVQYIVATTSDYANRTAPVTIDCSGTSTFCGTPVPCQNPSVAAYVCPGISKETIWVCPANFFSHPVLDKYPSQELILYHEITHWAGTRDYAYGCDGCKSLAATSPVEARNNADSYTLFAAYLLNDGNPCGIETLALLALLIGLVFLLGRRVLVRRAGSRGAA